MLTVGHWSSLYPVPVRPVHRGWWWPAFQASKLTRLTACAVREGAVVRVPRASRKFLLKVWVRTMKIECFRQVCAGQTETHCDYLCSLRSQNQGLPSQVGHAKLAFLVWFMRWQLLYSLLSWLTRRGVIFIINDSIRHQAGSHHHNHLQGKVSRYFQKLVARVSLLLTDCSSWGRSVFDVSLAVTPWLWDCGIWLVIIQPAWFIRRL